MSKATWDTWFSHTASRMKKPHFKVCCPEGLVRVITNCKESSA
ncbi:MAG TPA: hypothetical protein PKJ19_08465 [Flavobacteriales bacterium]|nr:hypothetical protein [Flavobacteriales bacterium]